MFCSRIAGEKGEKRYNKIDLLINKIMNNESINQGSLNA